MPVLREPCPSAHRARRSAQERRLWQCVEYDAERHGGQERDPQVLLVERISESERVEARLASVRDPQNRLILQYVAEGYDLDEVAELTGLRYKQVESRLYRMRQKLGAQWHAQEGA